MVPTPPLAPTPGTDVVRGRQRRVMALHTQEPAQSGDDLVSIRPQFSQSGLVGDIPRLRLPDKGMPPGVAYQVVHDELLLDGAARLNLATFVTTWMDPEA